MRNGKGLFSVFLLVCLVFVTVPTAYSAVPAILHHQGHLTYSNGTPVNGVVSVTFRIYNSETALIGEALWVETQDIQVNNGNYSVLLGSTNSIGVLAFDEPYWLGVELAGEELGPRAQLASAPYALQVGIADGVADGALGQAAFAPGTITNTELATGAIDPNKLAQSCGDLEALVKTAAGWECRPVMLVSTGDLQRCYTGPINTHNVGECQEGLWQWDGSAFGPCTGEVAPVAEACSDGLDNDCNGSVDDGC